MLVQFISGPVRGRLYHGMAPPSAQKKQHQMHHHKFNDFPNGFSGAPPPPPIRWKGLERGGQGPSVWDSFTKLPGKTLKGATETWRWITTTGWKRTWR